MKHPAKYSDVLLPVLADAVPPERFPYVLDPFAGTGKIHLLPNVTLGIELEAEWARMHEMTLHANSLNLMRAWVSNPDWGQTFDAVVTSPCYGNRMADHHEAKDASKRNTYRHVLDRPLTVGSSAGMQWGSEYRLFHREAWELAAGVLRPGGRLVVNIKDHIRGGKQQYVSWWHYRTILDLGYTALTFHCVETPGQRHGQNGDKRIPYEWVFVFEKAA